VNGPDARISVPPSYEQHGVAGKPAKQEAASRDCSQNAVDMRWTWMIVENNEPAEPTKEYEPRRHQALFT